MEFRHHNDKPVSTHTRSGVVFANGGEQAPSQAHEEDVALNVAKPVIDLFKVVDVDEKSRDSLRHVIKNARQHFSDKVTNCLCRSPIPLFLTCKLHVWTLFFTLSPCRAWVPDDDHGWVPGMNSDVKEEPCKKNR